MESILCFEAGGTKTNCLICDFSGTVLGFSSSDSENLGFGSREEVVGGIEKAIQKAMVEAHISKKDIIWIFATYFSGEALIYEVTRKYTKDSHVVIVSEQDAALFSVIISDVGIVASSGTGSFAYAGNKKGEKYFVGALGAILGDEGSGFDIGRKVIQACIYSLDKRGPFTVMTELVREKWKIDGTGLAEHDKIWGIVNPVLQSRNFQKMVASLTSVVETAADLNDSEAVRILQNAGEEMGKQVIALMKSFKIGTNPVQIGWQGGAWKSGRQMLESFKKYIYEKKEEPVEFVQPLLTPVFGTLLGGLSKINKKWDSDFVMKLVRSEKIE